MIQASKESNAAALLLGMSGTTISAMNKESEDNMVDIYFGDGDFVRVTGKHSRKKVLPKKAKSSTTELEEWIYKQIAGAWE